MARIVVVLFVSVVVAGCGARSESARDRPTQFDPAHGDVAQVGTETITSEQVDAVLDETAASFRALDRPFPEAGTPYYLDLRDEAVQDLLRRSVDEQEAGRLDVTVDDADVNAAFDRLDRSALEQEEHRMALTVDRVRTDIRDRQLLEALFAAVVEQKPENETGLEAMKAWVAQVESEVRSARFAPGWEPTTAPRSPVPPELAHLPHPAHECDLQSGTYTLWEVAAHGCVSKLGIPMPGETAKLCPDIPIEDFAVSGLPDDGPYLQYETSLMDTAPSCAPYPETTYTFRAGGGGCHRGEACWLGAPDPGATPRPKPQSPSRQ